MGFAFVHFSRILAVIPWNFWKKSWELAELKNSVFLLLHPHDNQLNLLVSSLKQHLRINMQYSVPTYLFIELRFSKYVVNISHKDLTSKKNRKREQTLKFLRKNMTYLYLLWKYTERNFVDGVREEAGRYILHADTLLSLYLWELNT